MKASSRAVAFAAATVLAAGGAVAAGVVGSTSASAAGSGRATFTVALTEKTDSLNPYTGITASSFEMWGLMYPTLTTPSEKDMTPTPSLATSWKHSPDGLTWTYKIVSNAKWSDGTPLTSKDVAYSLNAVVNGGPEATTWSSYLNQVTKVDAPNPTTVVLHLKKPNVVLPAIPVPIVPEHVWGKMSASQVRSYANTPGEAVTSGPFLPVSADSTLSNITFKRNPDYWGDRSTIGKVVFVYYKEEDAAVQALKKGDVDFVEDITGLSLKELKGTPDIKTHIGVAPGFDEIAFNTGSINVKTGKPMGNPNPAILDPRFRHALGYAINKKVIVDKVYQGLATPGNSIVPDGNPYQWKPTKSEAYTFDLAKARRLLDAAGYTMGSDGTRNMPDGKPIGTLRLYARSDSPTSQGTLEYFKEWLHDLGINAKLTVMSDDKLTDIILEGDYDIFQWGWLLDPDPDSMLSYMTCGQRGGWSDSWYCNKQYDAMYVKQHTDLNPATRKPILLAMQRKLYEDAPYLVTTYNATGEAYRSDRFTGFTPQPEPNGVYLIQFGPYNYVHIKPVSGANINEAAEVQNSNRNSFLYLLIGAVVVIAVAGFIVARRRARTAEDRE